MGTSVSQTAATRLSFFVLFCFLFHFRGREMMLCGYLCLRDGSKKANGLRQGSIYNAYTVDVYINPVWVPPRRRLMVIYLVSDLRLVWPCSVAINDFVFFWARMYYAFYLPLWCSLLCLLYRVFFFSLFPLFFIYLSSNGFLFQVGRLLIPLNTEPTSHGTNPPK